MKSIKLNKILFTRNRDREKEAGDFFNKTYVGLTNIIPLIFAIFFTPAIITTSFLSKEILVIIANLSLSLGYTTNFLYRMFRNEVSKAELLITLITLTAFLAIAYFLCPPIASLTFISVLGFVNQMAVAVNLFFLIKHIVVPPCKKLIENVAQYLGFDIAGRYYSKPPLTLDGDRYVIDNLLRNTYGHDSFSPEYKPQELNSFNKLLTKLSHYIDKYDESIFGYINNRAEIADLEDQISKLTTQGIPDSGYTFIKRKIEFKTTKIKMLQEARETVLHAIQNPQLVTKHILRFFNGVSEKDLDQKPQEVLNTGLENLQKEIQRQQQKISSLEECLPTIRKIC